MRLPHIPTAAAALSAIALAVPAAAIAATPGPDAVSDTPPSTGSVHCCVWTAIAPGGTSCHGMQFTSDLFIGIVSECTEATMQCGPVETRQPGRTPVVTARPAPRSLKRPSPPGGC
jgi:hypothetical protein